VSDSQVLEVSVLVETRKGVRLGFTLGPGPTTDLAGRNPLERHSGISRIPVDELLAVWWVPMPDDD
jgi:hypothetical protein